MNFATRKPVEFTPVPVSYADLLPYLHDNSMVAITPAKVHQPRFLQGYNSNETCAYHGVIEVDEPWLALWLPLNYQVDMGASQHRTSELG